jgi:hypothetical protein
VPQKPSRRTVQRSAEARRRDDEIREQSTRLLQDADQVRRFALHAATGGVSDRILGYSLRNQVLLQQQAEQAGIDLTDVDTFKGWLARGRCVRRGETGLRVVRPTGNNKKPAAEGDELGGVQPSTDTGNDAEQSGSDEPGTGKPRRPAFRTEARFDVSQTDPLPLADRPACDDCSAEAGEPCRAGCTCAACVDPMPHGDAAETLCDHLTGQIQKAGYVIEHETPAAESHSAPIRTNHDKTTVYIQPQARSHDPETVAALAVTLADIIARADQAAKARRAERAAAKAAT